MLRGPRTAVRGNQVAAVGMAIAVVATLLDQRIDDWGLIVAGLVIGTAVGVPSARSVKMTAMPQMVALFNGVGGGAVALISIVEYREALEDGGVNPELEVADPDPVRGDHRLDLLLGLDHRLPQAPGALKRAFRIPRQVNAGLAALRRRDRGRDRRRHRVGGAVLAAAAGLGPARPVAVLPIGGADMPVVISTLNAFTGLGAAAAGLALDNTALIVAGMLVGASGSILTKQMAEAMNRSIGNVFFGGFGARRADRRGGDEGGTVRSTSAADVAIQLSYARLVVVVPGYGMAVAQAQRAVADLATELEKRGVEVLYASIPSPGACRAT